MRPEFHLSIGVKSIEASVDFFAGLLKGHVTHRDPSGYVNIDLYGCQLTLKRNETIDPDLPDLHFGFNLELEEFEAVVAGISATRYESVVMRPKVVDAGTPMERKKMYLRCPTGYLIELKGYRR